MIPTFPEFKKVDIDDREAVESHTHRYPPYSDFNFTSLLAWDTNGERMISELNRNLIVRFTDYSTHEPFLSFLGSNEILHTTQSLMSYARTCSLPETLKLVPEISTRGLVEAGFRVKEDRDNFDYIYDIAKLTTFTGKNLERKRTSVNKFKRENQEAQFEILNLVKKDVRRNILNTIHIWKKRKEQKGKSIKSDNEFIAINRLCKTMNKNGFLVTAISVRGLLAAFSIDEILPDDYVICHFWKADVMYNGVYDLLMQEKSKYFVSLGNSFINYEQDLGIPNLRFSKASFRPAKMLKKYNISDSQGR